MAAFDSGGVRSDAGEAMSDSGIGSAAHHRWVDTGHVEPSPISRQPATGTTDTSPRLVATSPPPSRWVRVVEASSRHGTRPWVMTTDALSIIGAILWFGLGVVPAATTAVGFVFLAGIAGFYRSRLDPSILNDVVALVGRLLIASTVTYSLSGNGTGTIAALGDDLGRVWWQSIVAASFALIASRTVMYSIVRSARRRGWVNHRTLIVGAGTIGSRLAEDLDAHPEYGLRPVAFYDRSPPGSLRSRPLAGGWRPQTPSTDEAPSGPPPGSLRSRPLAGGWRPQTPSTDEAPSGPPPGSLRSRPPIYRGTLDEAIERARASTVVLAPVALPDADLIQLIQTRHRDMVEFYFVPRLHPVNSAAGREIERVRSLPLVRLRRAAHRSTMWTAKAILDRVLAATALLLLAPALLALAAAVALFVGRPVLFSQRRVGMDGQHFSILKFRSLPDAPPDESDTAWAAETHRRPTLLGRLLRESSLDELPQLWNILRGDMSFVGPRPERPHFVGTFRETYTHYDSRHRVKSGLTGLAQVNGLRGDTSISERAEFDNVYVETWSLGEDIKIMIRTIGSILKRSGR